MTTHSDTVSRPLASLRPLALLALPVIGLGLLIARPGLDVEWRHQPSHFWLVLLVAAVNVGLAILTNEAAMRRRDARLVLISLAFWASAGFLGLHALATPGVLLPGSSLGFVIATPVGLFLASLLAAASALPLGGPRGQLVLGRARALRIGLVILLVGWGVASILRVPPFTTASAPLEVALPLRLGAIPAIALYAYAAWHFGRLYLRRGRPLLLAVVVAFILLAEAMLTIAVSRDWHLSWWEWHLLMAIAFGAVAVGARVEYGRERSVTATFGGLYLSSTLQRLDRWHGAALADITVAHAGGDESSERVLERLRMDGATAEELALLERAARELQRADELFRPYLPQQFVDHARTDPARARLGSGEEREVTILFADLSGFTSFSEQLPPTRVVELLNAVWTAGVPAITTENGVIESFAGDGLLAIFNALGDQPDHAIRATRAAFGLLDAVSALAAERDQVIPRFHIGLNSGLAFVGSIGGSGRQAFAAIGDTTNLGARLLAIAGPGEVVIGERTRELLGDAAVSTPLEPVRVKGKRDPVHPWRLDTLA
jgi:class 3 adenylate cyclase